jgi:tRNA (cmo5U34)-methyltransferase
MSDVDVGQFFDALTGEYTTVIERCFPRYQEMLWALLNYLPESRRFDSILELGCGTGNLTSLIHDAFPQAALRVVDVSKESLDVCRSRLGACDRFVCDQNDFGNVEYSSGSFDLVVSSIAIHHLESAGKQSLFRRINDWLTDDGILCFADQCAGATDDLNARHMQNWKQCSIKAGSTEAAWEMWMQHQAESDHHDTLVDQLDWLQAAGFPVVDCPWRYLLWSVIQARKQRHETGGVE